MLNFRNLNGSMSRLFSSSDNLHNRKCGNLQVTLHVVLHDGRIARKNAHNSSELMPSLRDFLTTFYLGGKLCFNFVLG